jgi:hydrogenase-4 component B
MIVLGLGSAVLGILFALAQGDLKRLLAYSSVENIGWIVAALGLGLIGMSHQSPAVTALGFAAALLHVVNHAFFKGLLFLAAGSVVHATGTRELDRMGGLLQRMPWTAATFLVGVLAISGLPPWNGFLSEWTLVLASWQGVISGTHRVAAGALVVVAGVALVAGLAVACFTRLFGFIFLGEPRSDSSVGERPHDPGPLERWPMVALAAGCALMAILAPWLFRAVRSPVQLLARQPVAEVEDAMAQALGGATWLVGFGFAMVVLSLGLLWLRHRQLQRWQNGRTVTWDCGYARPTSRMQYTASSFAQPITRMFGGLLRTRTRLIAPQGMFPREGSLATETPDPCAGHLYQPAFVRLNEALSRFRWLQQGRVQIYVLYVALTLVVLLVWKLK